MRFSLKWLLVAVAYAAVACASVRYATAAWNGVLSALLLTALAGSVVGAVVRQGRARAWFVGFLVFSLVGQGAVFKKSPAPAIPFRWPNSVSLQEVAAAMARRIVGSDVQYREYLSKRMADDTELHSIDQVLEGFQNTTFITFTTRDKATGTLRRDLQQEIPLTALPNITPSTFVAGSLMYHFVFLSPALVEDSVCGFTPNSCKPTAAPARARLKDSLGAVIEGVLLRTTSDP